MRRPVSAYSLFFRNAQAAIKCRNPSATFGDVSKIVASMWDGLDDQVKNVHINNSIFFFVFFFLGITSVVPNGDVHVCSGKDVAYMYLP